MSASDSKSSRYSTSTASSAAPSGVRNTAAMPAATPATIRIRRSATETPRMRPQSEPSAPPICMVGPSRPPAPPDPSVKMEAMVFTHVTRLRMMPSWRWKASIIASPPPPRVSGASSEMMPLASAPAAGSSASSQGRKWVTSVSSGRNVSPWARSGRYPPRSSSTRR
jgi:hypothetical protein